MKYKVGDKVKIKSLEWYNQNKEYEYGFYVKNILLDNECGFHVNNILFDNEMSKCCSKTAVITKANENSLYYKIDIDSGSWFWYDWMFEDDFSENIVELKISNDSELMANDSTSINIKEVNKTTFEDILTQMLSTYKAKNADYGNSFDKTLNEFGLVASVVRLNDKMERIKSLIKSDAKVLDEKIDDTLLDMANYAVLTLLWLRNKDSDIVSGTVNDIENHSVAETKLPHEYSVGEIFTDANGVKLKAVKSNYCDDCCYRSLHSGFCTGNLEKLPCVSFNRKYGEEVKFIKVD